MSNNHSNPSTFLVLQVDLAEHTNWLKENTLEKHFAKKQLAKSFIVNLKEHEFEKLFWSGDGGVFVCNAEGRQDYDIVVEVADTVYDLFEKWKKDYKELDTIQLELRVSAHIIPIFTDDDPSFWTSIDLNYFIKSEKKEGKNGFALSQQIKTMLTEQKQNRFEGHVYYLGKEFPINLYVDSKHRTEKTGQQ